MPTMKEIKPLARPPLLHVSVQESLKSYIDDNALSPGAPLPPENDLAQQLGVSRNSVREAIKALESLGILETRRGIGVFVKAFSFEPLLANLAYGLGGALREVEEVLEIRRVLEVGLIGKTIALIGEADLAELKDTVERMRRRAERNESFAEEDQQFHHLLFRCQNNRMLTSLIDVFWMAFYKASDFVNLANADPMGTWRDHQEIYAAIEARDGAAARSRLDQHYDGIARLLATRKGAKAEN
jgi:DNA-binding FadR family transcriptional regulator